MDKTTEDIISRVDDELTNVLIATNSDIPMENLAIKSIIPNWKLPILFCHIANGVWPEWSISQLRKQYPSKPMQTCPLNKHKEPVEQYINQLQQHGIDSQRINDILLRIDRWGGGYAWSSNFFQQVSVVDEWWLLDCNLDLLNAISELGAEQATSLFETTELHELARKVNFVRYLNYRHTPIYSLDELADLLESFLDHTNNNSEELLRCGYPHRGFTESSWLASQLDQLYFLEHPFATIAVPDDPCNLIRIFANRISEKWQTLPEDAAPIKTNFFKNASRFKGRIYLEDGYILQESVPDNIPSPPLEKQAERLMWLRSRVLKAKLRILRTLVSALRRKDATELWEKCLLAFTDNLTTNQVEFLLNSELCYTYYDIRTDQIGNYFSAQNAGGIVDILSMIGHCEKEITLHTFSRTRDRLSGIIRDDRLNAPRLNVKSYYEAIRLGYDKCFDEAYDEFQAKELEEKLFWNHFIERFNTAVKYEFKSDVIIHKQVKNKHVAKFEPKMTQFAQHLDSSLELTDECPNVITSVAVSSSVQHQAEYDQVFRQDGDMWTVKFDSVKKLVKDLDGMHYIKLLLESPKKQFRADDLYYRVHPVDSEQNSNEAAELSMDELLQQYQIHQKISLQISEPEDRKRYTFLVEKLQTCKEDLRDALMSKDADAASRLREERALLNRMISAEFDKKGRPRAVSDPIKNKRQAVSKSITNALKNIKDVHPNLAEHFSTIKLGTYCYYNCDLDWQTDEMAHTIHHKEKPQSEWCA